ncbi:2501_t:CDS:2 [Paraglomus brasilianum]|uniref:2501_t:CDS:1 n=1 Tax=Paraglomus brasilianum TaxID=144538 RepID=A0A9N9F427_9GLOM|nr:2501_t:CDS:2 [Paraglomus brasilianum]
MTRLQKHSLRSRRPLNYREKIQKIKKNRLIHKAKVKKEFHKFLKKDDLITKTPEFIKKIFEEGEEENVKETIDHEQQSQGTDNNDNAERIVDEHSPDETTDSETSNDEHLNTDESAKGKAQDVGSHIKRNKKHKPNPFQKVLNESERRRQEKQEQIKAAHRQKELENQRQEVYK